MKSRHERVGPYDEERDSTAEQEGRERKVYGRERKKHMSALPFKYWRLKACSQVSAPMMGTRLNRGGPGWWW